MLKLGTLSRMSDIRLKSEFKVGMEDYKSKNSEKKLTPAQLRACLVSEREWFFITPNQIVSRKATFQKSGMDKMLLKSLRKEATFENKVILTNKL